jgi:hypothetical protein
MSEVLVGEIAMLVSPWMGGGPESPPNIMPPSSPGIVGKPDDFDEPQPHASAADSAMISASATLENRGRVVTDLAL